MKMQKGPSVTDPSMESEMYISLWLNKTYMLNPEKTIYLHWISDLCSKYSL